MSRPLTVFLPLPGDREASGILLSDPGEWLPAGSTAAGPDAWWVPLHGAGMRRSVRCEVGQPWRTGDGVWRSLRWQPAPEEADRFPVDRLLPSFRGELGIARVHRGPSSLVLAGSYDLPAGRVGDLADAVGLRRVADRTATTFLVDISTQLQGRSNLVDA